MKPNKKLQALRLERFRMHAAIFALGAVLGAYAATKEPPKPPSTIPPSTNGDDHGRQP